MGLARTLESQNGGSLIIAPLIEHGTGNYDSYLHNGVHGEGHTKYTAGGLIGRKTQKNGFYVEGSFRAGRSENTFSSDDFIRNGEKTHVSYDSSAPVYAGHLRVGRALRMNKNNILDVYGIFFHTQQSGTDTNLSTGEHYDFSSVSSTRFRAGYRMTTRTSRISRVYTGLALQYETNTDSVATYESLSTPTVGSKGASGMIELGWLIKPLRNNPWVVDVHATGYAGHQQGFTAMAKIKKSF